MISSAMRNHSALLLLVGGCLVTAGCTDASTAPGPSARVADLCDGAAVRVSLSLRVEAQDADFPVNPLPQFLTTLVLRPTASADVNSAACARSGVAEASSPLPFTVWANNTEPITFRSEFGETVFFGTGPVVHVQQGRTTPGVEGLFQARLYVRDRVFGFWDYTLPDGRVARGSVYESL